MKKIFVTAALTCLALPVTSNAAEFQTPGALGMGRAGLARTTDAYAAFWNPAGLAFYEKPFSARFNAGVGVSISESLADNIDKIGKLDLDTSKLNYTTTSDALSATGKAVQFTSLINDLAKNKGDLAVNVDAALGFQYRNYGLGIGVSTEMGAGFGKVDTTNLRAGSSNVNTTTVATLVTELGATSATSRPTIKVFSEKQYADIVEALNKANGSPTPDSQKVANALEGQLAKENKTALTSEELSQGLITMAESLNKGSIDNNKTSIDLRGLMLAEVPLGYGHKFDFGSLGKVGVGASLKVMQGTVYAQEIEVMKVKDSNDLVKKVKDSKSDSTTVGVDLGVLWRYEEIKALGPINLALVGKNLNAPEFDAPLGAGKVKVEPQARFGLALEPFHWLSIAADVDLTKNKTVLPGRDSQNIGAGIELSPVSFFALRAGLFNNIAIPSSSPVMTAGLSLGPHWLRFEIDAAVSTESGRYDNTSYPREAKVEFGLSTMF